MAARDGRAASAVGARAGLAFGRKTGRGLCRSGVGDPVPATPLYRWSRTRSAHASSSALRACLFGGATISAGGATDNAFAMLVGGGLDIGLRKGIGLRLVQADWFMTEFGHQTQDRQGRVSAGIVIKFWGHPAS